MATTGYSGTQLAKKLGLVPDAQVLVKGAPTDYSQLLAPVPEGVSFVAKLAQTTDIVHLFVQKRAELARELISLRTTLRKDAAIWISWPKKASKMPTDITEDTIREVALPLGFVDIKVRAVNEIWSGLKLVIRKELR